MNDYGNLTEFLQNTKDQDEIELTFIEIERIIGDKLPSSAFDHIAWWSNTRTHSQGKGWLNAGWIVAQPTVVHKTHVVKFIRNPKEIKESIVDLDLEKEKPAEFNINCGTLVYCIFLPIIPLILGIYYKWQGKDDLARIYFRLMFVGWGVAALLYLILKLV